MKSSLARLLQVVCSVLVAAGLLTVVPSVVDAQTFIAGVDPSQRPAGAPIVKAPQKAAEWKANALRGVSDPKPASLKFLDDQGAWYTPFNRPGMPAPYDVRGLHRPERR